MNIYAIIGISMSILFLAAGFIFACKEIGFKLAFASFAIAIGLAAWVIISVHFLELGGLIKR